jgi:predicted small integral membrane protein
MWERLIVVIAAVGGMLLYDGVTLRKKITRREKGVYVVIVAGCLYMGIDYVVNRDWFDMYDIVEFAFGEAAKQVEATLGVKW